MRNLIIGFLTFCLWSWLASYWYVCKIEGLCNQTSTLQAPSEVKRDSAKVDSLVQKKAILPADLTILFNSDKADYNPTAETDKYIEESKAYLDQNATAKIVITGYTDATGSIPHNEKLGLQRAYSVRDYFTAKGLVQDRFVVTSKGEKDPATDNKTREGRTKNRRTVITIK